VTAEQQAIYLNALPLLALGIVYLAAGASLVPALLRERSRMRALALALVFPCGGLAALTFGVLVLVGGEPVGGHPWPALAAVLVALGPAIAFFTHFSERGLMLTTPVRAREAEDRHLIRVATTSDEVARRLLDRAAAIARVEFAALTLVDPDGKHARGVLARQSGQDVPWFNEVRLDLKNEPSGVASAFHEAAPFAVFDAPASKRLSARLVAETGARSVAFVPLIASQRVVGIMVVASITGPHAFSTEEISTLQALALEAAEALEQLGASEETPRDRERLAAEIAHRVRSETNVDQVLRVAVEEVAKALGVQRSFVRLGDLGTSMPIRAEWDADGVEPLGDVASRLPVSNLAAGDRRTVAVPDVAVSPELDDDDEHSGRSVLLGVGTRAVLAAPIIVFGRLLGVFSVHRTTPGEWSTSAVALVEAAAREVGFALHAASLLAESDNRLARQTGLVRAAEALTSELELAGVLRRLVEEVVALLSADAADCWLFDEERRLLRCRANYALPASELGREIPPEGTIGEAIATRRAVLRRDFARTEQPPPSPNYRTFEEVMDAPIVVRDEVRGVLGVCSLTGGRFADRDLDLLDAFATLASIAIRNAEAFEERSRQARVQRGFYRIASILSQPLSSAATLDAVAQAAGEAFGGVYAAVVMPRGDSLSLVGRHALPEPLQAALEEGLDETGLMRHAAAERRILAAPRLAEDERFVGRWRDLGGECGFRSLLLVPVEAPRGESAGLVLVFFDDERLLANEDLEVARQLAGAARGALERSELFEAERTSRSLAQQLAHTGSLLAAELDPAAVLDEVVEQAPALLAADACAIRIVDRDDLVVTAVHGDDAELALGARSEAAGWLSGEVVQTRRPLAVADATGTPALVESDPLLQAGFAAYLGVPLVGPEGALHGVLALYARRPREWRREEIEALQALAANTSGALSNAELYQRVALEKERSAAILENIADGIVAIDREGRVVLWNRAAEAITGVPASESLGREPEQVLGRELSGAAVVPVLRGGGETWLSVTEAVMHDPAGAISGRIFAFRDISADRLVEEMKSEFVATVSHELRGPLTSIFGFAETLLREDVLFGDEERRLFLRYISSESERLTQIVDALLNVARLDTGDLHVNLAPTEVAPLLQELVSSVEGDGGEAHSFVLDLPTEPLAAEADADKLRQVLSQLVDNAVKYSPAGGTVTVTARRKSDTVEFQVRDQGIGIPELDRERIFRKFARAADEGGGMGLGLFIVQGLVNAMGGRIWVESDEGQGSSFAFELPAARV
jgi:GAF domain-containing protein/two-component sensor histidine kinase